MKRQLALGQMIFLLERINPAAEVRYDFASFIPAAVDSYRGDYSELALGYKPYPPNPEKAPSVKEILDRLQGCVGKTFMGYKGGDYVMGEETRLWVANWGESTSTAICGVQDNEWCAFIETQIVL